MKTTRARVAIPLAILAGLIATVIAVAALGGGLGGLGVLSATGDSAADHGSESDAGGAERAQDPGTSEAKDGQQARNASAVAPLSRAVISSGHVSLRAEQVNRARSEVQRLVSSWGGVVAEEQTSSDSRGRVVASDLTLRVPSDRFSTAMTALAGVGEVQEESRSSEDVTTKVIDNAARVRAAEASIRKIEALLSRADDLGDIISIESDLARRQADLDSLKSQQAWLADQTTLSTINVYLSRTDSAGPAEDRWGFLAGLTRGWHALTGALVVGLTALGAVLPFAVVALLLGVPAWVVMRRRSARLSAASAPARTA